MTNRFFTRSIKKDQQHERTASRRDARLDAITLRAYLNAMWQHKVASLTIFISFSITIICSGVLIPFLLAHVVDLISQKQAFEYGSELFTTLAIALGAVGVATTTNAIGLRGFAWLDPPAQNYLRMQVLDRLMSESASFYSNTKSGSLMGHMTAYTNGYVIVQEIIMQRGLNLFVPLVIGMFVIAWQSLQLAGLLLIIAIFISTKTLIDSRRRTSYRRARKEAMSQVNGFLGDVITNNATVRMFASEQQEKNSLSDKQAMWKAAANANLRIFGTHYVTLAGSVNALQIIGIGLAAWLAATGAISLGLVVFTIAYFQRLSSGLLELAPLVQSFQGALMDAAPITEILIAPRTIIDSPDATMLTVTKGAITLSNVRHRYEKGSPAVFKDLNLEIPAGQSIGIVGRSGGGKTTLTNLLLRFSDIDAGSITIDGQDISSVTQRSLRRAISYVPQDSQLFHRSVRENIAYGNPEVSEEMIIAAAKRAHIWKFIQTLPQGLDTEVGERGLKLSGGQRQRIAIARAILKNAPILIFDEATSALDSESEHYIRASTEALIKDRTSLIIAHRLSTIQKMDRIIVLDKGAIVQDGTHEELIAQEGLYGTLWNHQSGGFIK